jgi:hypothetical protein
VVHSTRSNPNWRAMLTETAFRRSLNEPVGFTPSTFKRACGSPLAAITLAPATSGVRPSPSDVRAAASVHGSKAASRQSGLAVAAEAFRTAPAPSAATSYATSRPAATPRCRQSGQPKSSGASGRRAPHVRHTSIGGVTVTSERRATTWHHEGTDRQARRRIIQA